jgi:hypothetical protein
MLSIVKNCLTCCGIVPEKFIQLKGCGKTIRNRNQYALQNNFRIDRAASNLHEYIRLK